MQIVRRFLRVAYAPSFFAGFVGAALGLLGVGAPPAMLGALLVAAIGVSLAVERLLPHEPAWNRDHGDGARDVAHALVNEAANTAAVLALPLVAAIAPGLGLWPGGWPLVAQLALAIVVADAGITLAHFASHRVAWLWRLHAVHHAVERLYGFNGLMKHPLHQAVELAAGTAPLVLLGMPQRVAWLLAFAVAIQLLLQHSNVDLRIGALARWWAVAPAHRYHHVASARDGDVNFGLFSTAWDRLLGTFRATGPPPRAGALGVEGRPDYPRGYAAQLVEPFRRAPLSAAARATART